MQAELPTIVFFADMSSQAFLMGNHAKQYGINILSSTSIFSDISGLVKQYHPDALIMKFEPFEKIEEHVTEIKRDLPELPIIVISTYRGPEAVKKICDNGALSYLDGQKCGFEDMASAIEKAKKGESTFIYSQYPDEPIYKLLNKQ